MLHETYLPFTDAQLRTHFAPISGDEHADADRHLAYYRTSLARLADHQQAGSASDPRATKRARQVEKDERFWIVAALMALHHGPSRVRAYGELMKRSGVRPPGTYVEWQDALAGELHLYFETGLSSPKSYREYLLQHLDDRSPIPYVREAAGRAGLRLEGATQVDALLIAPQTGAGVLIEAKVMPYPSMTVSVPAVARVLFGQSSKLSPPRFANRSRADATHERLAPGVLSLPGAEGLRRAPGSRSAAGRTSGWLKRPGGPCLFPC